MKKLEKTKTEIGYSDKFLSSNVLDTYYSYLDVGLKNSIKIEMSILGNQLELDKFSYSVQDAWMQYAPDVVNAEYRSEINTIC